MKKNFTVVTRFLAFGAVVLIWRRDIIKEQPQKDMLMWIALSSLMILSILTVIDLIKPDLFKDRPMQPK